MEHDHEMHDMSKMEHDHGNMTADVDAHAGHDMNMKDMDMKAKDHSGHDMTKDMGAHAGQDMSTNRGEQESHSAHVDHSGHEQMFRKKFWISLVLSIPVLIFSPDVQSWLGYSVPDFPGSKWIIPVFAVIVFLYGGLPFLQMAVPEIKNRKPGMMTLISLAISVAFVYSVAALFLPTSVTFFWNWSL